MSDQDTELTEKTERVFPAWRRELNYFISTEEDDDPPYGILELSFLEQLMVFLDENDFPLPFIQTNPYDTGLLLNWRYGSISGEEGRIEVTISTERRTGSVFEVYRFTEKQYHWFDTLADLQSFIVSSHFFKRES